MWEICHLNPMTQSMDMGIKKKIRAISDYIKTTISHGQKNTSSFSFGTVSQSRRVQSEFGKKEGEKTLMSTRHH